METNVKKIIYPIILIVVALIVYYPILGNQLLDFWDDQWVVMNAFTENGISINNLCLIMTSFYHGQYAPFNEYLYLFLYNFFGYNAFYFHLSSLILHCANAVLVYLILNKLLLQSAYKEVFMSKYLPFMTAFIFLVTTVNVESVAWMSASKVLVYSLFYLLATYYFLLYIEKKHKWKYLLLTYVFFICSFLGKEQAVTFPLFMLLIYYFLGYNLSSKSIWTTLLPFFLLSLCFGFITMFSQLATGGGILSPETTYPLWQRIIYACYAFCEYFFKCLFPVKLSYLYPFPSTVGEPLPYWLFLYPVLLVSFVFLLGKYIYHDNICKLGVLMFSIHIVTALHLIPLSRFVVVADRYIYLSSIGVAFLLSYYILSLYAKYNNTKIKMVLKILFLVYILYLGIYTNYRSRCWYDTNTLKKEMRYLLNQRDDFNETTTL